jgi:hypothetical protein
VRWSLEGASADVADELATYVEESSHARYNDLPGLRFKTWRIRPGQWFEGCYVFATEEDRADFQRTFSQGVADSPGSRIIGSPPVLVEECEILAIAEGREGFQSAARY